MQPTDSRSQSRHDGAGRSGAGDMGAQSLAIGGYVRKEGRAGEGPVAVEEHMRPLDRVPDDCMCTTDHWPGVPVLLYTFQDDEDEDGDDDEVQKVRRAAAVLPAVLLTRALGERVVRCCLATSLVWGTLGTACRLPFPATPSRSGVPRWTCPPGLAGRRPETRAARIRPTAGLRC